jgi:2'-5' RNA ligase
MNLNNFSKIYKGLEKERYFTTIWCTLNENVIPGLQEYLKPIQKYCEWLSTFGDWQSNPRFLPHISLRYLGFTDELTKEKLVADKERFIDAIRDSKVKKIELDYIGTWEQKADGVLTKASLNWRISELKPLKEIHKRLLEIPGYQFFQSLEGDNYSPHISLGQIKLENDNYETVIEYLNSHKFPSQKVKLEKFAINYADKDFREEFVL